MWIDLLTLHRDVWDSGDRDVWDSGDRDVWDSGGCYTEMYGIVCHIVEVVIKDYGYRMCSLTVECVLLL